MFLTFTKTVDIRKLVAAAICLLSLSLSVTTRRRCIKEARTRTGKKVLRTAAQEGR